MTIGCQQGEPVEEQVEWTRASRSPEESPDGAADLWEDTRSPLASGDGCRGPRGCVGLAREFQVDRLVHEPGRLAILTVLSSVTDADFLFLQRATGLTKGNLSSHLTKLEDAGLVTIEKRFIRKKPNTNVALTPLGMFYSDSVVGALAAERSASLRAAGSGLRTLDR